MQFRGAVTQAQPLDGQRAIDFSHHDAAVLCLDGTIHHDQITRMNAGALHRIALDAQKISRFLALDQQFVEIQARFDVIVRRRRKAGRDAAGKEWQRNPDRRPGGRNEFAVHDQ